MSISSETKVSHGDVVHVGWGYIAIMKYLTTPRELSLDDFVKYLRRIGAYTSNPQANRGIKKLLKMEIIDVEIDVDEEKKRWRITPTGRKILRLVDLWQKAEDKAK